MKEGFPVIKCLPSENLNHFLFWCPYCETWHVHGLVSGHRNAHCTLTSEFPSAFNKKGYILTPYTTAELRIMKKQIDVALKFAVYGKKFTHEQAEKARSRAYSSSF